MSCYNDKDEYIPDIKVHAFYETLDQSGVKIPDVGAGVYLYYRVYKDDFAGYTYQGEGIFIKENSSEIKPDVKHMIDESGSLSFIPEYMNENATIVIESNYYKGQFDLTSFSSTMNGAGFYKVFKP
ncbi:MAG: hypothetical protein LBV72_13890 [Tannerella sp.]|jgi:hypothetical protein|nr:hypothetical protein [Tannerella sp.]